MNLLVQTVLIKYSSTYFARQIGLGHRFHPASYLTIIDESTQQPTLPRLIGFRTRVSDLGHGLQQTSFRCGQLSRDTAIICAHAPAAFNRSAQIHTDFFSWVSCIIRSATNIFINNCNIYL